MAEIPNSRRYEKSSHTGPKISRTKEENNASNSENEDADEWGISDTLAALAAVAIGAAGILALVLMS